MLFCIPNCKNKASRRKTDCSRLYLQVFGLIFLALLAVLLLFLAPHWLLVLLVILLAAAVVFVTARRR